MLFEMALQISAPKNEKKRFAMGVTKNSVEGDILVSVKTIFSAATFQGWG